MGSGAWAPPAPMSAASDPAKAFMSVMSKLMARMPQARPVSSRMKMVLDLSSLPSAVVVR